MKGEAIAGAGSLIPNSDCTPGTRDLTTPATGSEEMKFCLSEPIQPAQWPAWPVEGPSTTPPRLAQPEDNVSFTETGGRSVSGASQSGKLPSAFQVPYFPPSSAPGEQTP